MSDAPEAFATAVRQYLGNLILAAELPSRRDRVVAVGKIDYCAVRNTAAAVRNEAEKRGQLIAVVSPLMDRVRTSIGVLKSAVYVEGESHLDFDSLLHEITDDLEALSRNLPAGDNRTPDTATDADKIEPEHRTKLMSLAEAGTLLGLQPETGSSAARREAAGKAVKRQMKPDGIRYDRVGNKYVFDKRQIHE